MSAYCNILSLIFDFFTDFIVLWLVPLYDGVKYSKKEVLMNNT